MSAKTLLLGLLDGLALVELGRQPFGRLLAKGPFDEPAGITTRGSGKAECLDSRLAFGRDNDFDRSVHAAPATLMVSLIDPSASGVSVTPWPARLASIRAFSTAYACIRRSSSFCSPQKQQT